MAFVWITVAAFSSGRKATRSNAGFDAARLCELLPQAMRTNASRVVSKIRAAFHHDSFVVGAVGELSLRWP